MNDTKPQFKKPILSKIYEALGCICFIVATLSAIGGILLFNMHHAHEFFLGLGIALVVAFIGLLQLGIAQVVPSYRQRSTLVSNRAWKSESSSEPFPRLVSRNPHYGPDILP